MHPSQGTQSAYPGLQYGYPAPGYYYPPPQQQAWQQTADWSSATQPQQSYPQSWGPPSNGEPPPPGTGPTEDTQQHPSPPLPGSWQTPNYWQPQWPAQQGGGWSGVEHWNGQWPPQQHYWSSSYNYNTQNYGYSNDTATKPPPPSRTDCTPPPQHTEATPPPTVAMATEEGRVSQPRIQQYSGAGYMTTAPSVSCQPTAPSETQSGSGVEAKAQNRGLLPPPPPPPSVVPSGPQTWSGERGDDQPPVRKRPSRWEQPPPSEAASVPARTENTSTGPSDKSAVPLTPDQWPPKLRDYIDRAFAACEGRAADLERVQQFLKVELNDIFRGNRAWDVDWDHKPLPLGRQNAPSYRGSRWDTPSPTHSSDFRNRGSYQPVTPTVGGGGRGKKKKGGLKRKRGGKMFFIDKTGEGVSEVEQQRLDQRALRFADGNKSSKKKLSVAELVAAATAGVREDGDLNWEEFAIEGTSQALEKPYLRLTSAPDPSAVRPLSVLRLSLAHVLGKWETKEDYRYTCEQFKSIRQDLTIQGIRNEFAVEVYESHARIALDNGDRGEFNQCQAQLKALYLEGVPGQQAEFVAYRILYLILTHNSADMSTEVKDLTSDLKSHPYVAHALRLWSSWQLGNYCQFFRLFKSAPGSGRSLLQLFLSRERLSALRTILKAFRPSVPLAHVAATLAFSSPEECRQWLAEIELSVNGSAQLDSKACLSTLQAKPPAQ